MFIWLKPRSKITRSSDVISLFFLTSWETSIHSHSSFPSQETRISFSPLPCQHWMLLIFAIKAAVLGRNCPLGLWFAFPWSLFPDHEVELLSNKCPLVPKLLAELPPGHNPKKGAWALSFWDSRVSHKTPVCGICMLWPEEMPETATNCWSLMTPEEITVPGKTCSFLLSFISDTASEEVRCLKIKTPTAQVEEKASVAPCW